MKFKAEMGHWSSVVGNSVHLIGEDGRFLGQIAIMCQDDRLRDKDVQTELCEKICAALNADLCASGQQVRALPRAVGDDRKAGWTLSFEDLRDIRDAAGDWGYTLDLEAVEKIVLEVERRILAALTPAPQPEGQVMDGWVDDKTFIEPLTPAPDAAREAEPVAWLYTSHETRYDSDGNDICDEDVERVTLHDPNSKTLLLSKRSNIRPLYAHPAAPAHNARLVLEDALTPAPDAAVAWRYRDPEDTDWRLSDDGAWMDYRQSKVRCEVQPLYLHPAAPAPGIAEAVKALANYQQADADGCMVLVSRQAIEECLPILRALANGGSDA